MESSLFYIKDYNYLSLAHLVIDWIGFGSKAVSSLPEQSNSYDILNPNILVVYYIIYIIVFAHY